MQILAATRQYEGTKGAWLIVHSNGSFLTARRSPTCQQDIGKWNWIGGGVDEGETPVQAALREFREEAGIDFTDRIASVMNIANIGNPISGGVCYFFTLDLGDDLSTFQPQYNEESNGERWMTLSELFANVQSLNWPTQASLGPLAAYLGIIP